VADGIKGREVNYSASSGCSECDCNNIISIIIIIIMYVKTFGAAFWLVSARIMAQQDGDEQLYY
jgi:hypothetical protein